MPSRQQDHPWLCVWSEQARGCAGGMAPAGGLLPEHRLTHRGLKPQACSLTVRGARSPRLRCGGPSGGSEGARGPALAARVLRPSSCLWACWCLCPDFSV